MNDDRWPRSANVPSDTPTMYQILPLKHHTDKYGKGHTESPCYRLVKSWKFDVGVT